MENSEIQLLTFDEKCELPAVLMRRSKFKSIVTNAIKYRESTFSNAIFITGKPGTGKTTLVTEFLQELQDDNKIDSYKRCTGHITQTSLFEFMRTSPSDGTIVHMFDDVDILYNQGCLEILKSALDTRNNNRDNRVVSYYTQGSCKEYTYTGFTILITNDPLTSPYPHQQAVLDRVHLMEIDLEPKDFMVFNTYLIQEYLNNNEDGLSDDVRQEVAEFFNGTVREWFAQGAFAKANINFSIRLIKKFIDLIVMFGDDWKSYSVDYRRLNAQLCE